MPFLLFLSSFQTLHGFFFFDFDDIGIVLIICTQPAQSLRCYLCVYDFRNNHLVLDNQIGLSPGKAVYLLLVFPGYLWFFAKD